MPSALASARSCFALRPDVCSSTDTKQQQHVRGPVHDRQRDATSQYGEWRTGHNMCAAHTLSPAAGVQTCCSDLQVHCCKHQCVTQDAVWGGGLLAVEPLVVGDGPAGITKVFAAGRAAQSVLLLVSTATAAAGTAARRLAGACCRPTGCRHLFDQGLAAWAAACSTQQNAKKFPASSLCGLPSPSTSHSPFLVCLCAAGEFSGACRTCASSCSQYRPPPHTHTTAGREAGPRSLQDWQGTACA